MVGRSPVSGRLSRPARVRLICGGCAIGLLAVEVCIGLFVRDRFIRPYFGDVLVGVLIWCLLRVFLPRRPILLSPWVLGFCFLAEFSQAIRLVELLGLSGNAFLRTLMGSSFSLTDLVCYTAGLLPVFLVEWVFFRPSGAKSDSKTDSNGPKSD